jgi:mRNA interferase HicA
VKYSELERLLRKAGCTVYREGSNHTLWYSPITGEKFPVGRHSKEEVPIGTLRNIMKAAGLE